VAEVSEPSEAENRRIIAARQRRMAVQMSRAGESMEAIATRLGVTRGAARKMVTREAREFADHNQTDDRRMVHVEALMELWRALYAPACNGDLEAVDRFLKVEERLSRLLALDLADLYAWGLATPPEGAKPGQSAPEANGSGPPRRGDGEPAERRFVRSTS
jgi:hypothetical protein